MKRSYLVGTLCLSAIFSATAFAAATAPAGAPAGSTGMCKDGSYYSGAVKKGACRGHQGVKNWWGAETASDASSGTTAPQPAAPPPPAMKPAAPSAAPAAPAAAPAAAPRASTMPAQAAPGGGPGEVWVNASSKVYHCPADKWYGKTKNGSYMSEADAKAKGYHADHGKPCQ